MLYALVTLCSLAGPCDQIRIPGEFASPVTCILHAEAYIAETTLSHNMHGITTRVTCRPERQR